MRVNSGSAEKKIRFGERKDDNRHSIFTFENDTDDGSRSSLIREKMPKNFFHKTKPPRGGGAVMEEISH